MCCAAGGAAVDEEQLRSKSRLEKGLPHHEKETRFDLKQGLKMRGGDLWGGSAHFRAEIIVPARRTADYRVQYVACFDTFPVALLTKKMRTQDCDSELFPTCRARVSEHVKTCHAALAGVTGVSKKIVVTR